MTQDIKHFIKTSLPMINLILALLVLRQVIVEPYVVPTGSMEPTLKTGDRLYALKCAYNVRVPFDYTLFGRNMVLFNTGKIHRGDVILFRAPRDPNITYVKRAIGLPGDKIEFRNGVLYVNKQEVPKSIFPNRDVMYDIEHEARKELYLENLTGKKHYVILDTAYDHAPSRSLDELQIPEGYLFAVGDNRDNSYDSRAWGFVPVDSLMGKGMFIWYSSWDKNPDVVESMKTERGLIEMILYFFIDFGRFFVHLIQGDAWIRYERIGTYIQ